MANKRFSYDAIPMTPWKMRSLPPAHDMFGVQLKEGDVVGFPYAVGQDYRVVFGEIIDILTHDLARGADVGQLKIAMPDKSLFTRGTRLQYPHSGEGFITHTRYKFPGKTFRTDWTPEDFWKRFGIER